jgi:hypothetical protein
MGTLGVGGPLALARQIARHFLCALTAVDSFRRDSVSCSPA